MSPSVEHFVSLVCHEIKTSWTSKRFSSQSELACTSGALRAARMPAALSANLSCARCHYSIGQDFYFLRREFLNMSDLVSMGLRCGDRTRSSTYDCCCLNAYPSRDDYKTTILTRVVQARFVRYRPVKYIKINSYT